MAQSQYFSEIAPLYKLIIWRNRVFLLTLRQYLNMVIWKILLLDARKR